MRLTSIIALALVLGQALPSRASSIMCDPGWAYGRPATTEESVRYLEFLAENNAAKAGEGGEERVCHKLIQVRKYIRAGCISKHFGPRIEEAFAPFACG